MRIYWTKKSVPELAGLSKQQRDEVWNATRWKHLRHWQFWAASVVWMTAVFVVMQLVDLIQGGSLATLVRMIILGAATGIGYVFVVHVGTQVRRPYMRALLESRRLSSDVDA